MKKKLLRCCLPVLALVLGASLGVATPQSQALSICPDIGCLDGYCRRDRDCTAAPGGTCNLFCATQGCCRYPAS